MWRRAPRTGEKTIPETDLPSLLPLTSSYDEEQHGSYVRYVEEALKNPSLRNIALTGNYGIGKSSILDAVRDEHKDSILNLSLSTLGEVQPEHPAAPEPGAESISLTNRIQKEIVKQLLYRELPARVPHSRYRRLGKFRFGRELPFTALAVAAVAALLVLLGLMPPLIGSKSGNGLVQTLSYVCLVALVSLMVTWLRMMLSSRWSIEKVSAAGTSVSLASSETYFDKYLDEIVYFFEVTEIDIVIFEDIDRFEDPRIFETLRELNTLLNGTKQLEEHSIRFVYAIKDSIFEQIGRDVSIAAGADAADVELARANRTKFFDQVIPVIPFITHRSARDLMAEKFEGTGVSTSLIDLAAKHLTDMRLIKNIYNEFIVFSGRLLGTDNGVPGLRTDALLAMVIYKNIHLSDFERISRGNSKLDTVYQLSRQAVRETIERLERRAREIESAITTGETEQQRAKLMGSRLRAYLDRVARHLNSSYGALDLRVDGQSFPVAQWGAPEFWRSLTTPGATLGVAIGPRGQQQTVLKCDLEDLGEALSGGVDPGAWAIEDRGQLAAEHDDLQALIEFVRHADLAGLTTKPEITAKVNEETKAFDLLVEETLESKLARELVRAGHIDQNFTLYVSQYYGVRVSAAVTSFIVHTVQPGKIDMHYLFPDPDDIKALLREEGQAFLTDQSAYNIAVVDYLAERNDLRLRPIMTNLTRLREAERKFFNAYLPGGDHAEAFTTQLAGQWQGVFGYLADEADVSLGDRAALLSAALLGGGNDVKYDLTEGFAQFVQDNVGNMPVLTGLLDSEVADRVVSVLRRAAVSFEDLSLLAPVVCRLVVDADLYVFSAENLRTALSSSGPLALDHIRATSPGIYKRCLQAIDRYAEITEADPETPYSVVEPAEFASVLNDLDSSANSDMMGRIIERAAPSCRVAALSEVPASAWPWLAKGHRFDATFDNVETYVDGLSGLDKDIADLLIAATVLTDVSYASEEDKQALAQRLLSAHQMLPDPQARVFLVSSLQLESMIDPELITPGPGALLSLLLEHRLIDDNAAAFTRFRDAGWPAIEAAIAQSGKFATFVSPELIDESSLTALFNSALIDEKVKRQILSMLPEYAPSGQTDGLIAAARFAHQASIQLGAGQLGLMAGAGVPADLLVQLVASAETELNDLELSQLLAAMPDPYRRLAGLGGENFSVLTNDAHILLLRRLKRQGIVKDFRKKRLDASRLNVNLA